MAALVQKLVVEDASLASPLLPQRVALVNPDGSPVELGGAVPGAATPEADGLMSKEDKAKLDGVAAGANKYSLSAATTGAIGGVRKAVVADDADVATLIAALKAAGIAQ